ncbi:receptor-like protein EIX1 [Vigna unguiculata]|uniref:receptor-like protein EIX1 n=1 Tax=Vigna unguiculata TaxID=3917 RepID=UPI0010170823|nr:receptor-like protein EIX1 [Vigna unguiculata]
MVCFSSQSQFRVLLVLVYAITIHKGVCSTNVKLSCNEKDRSPLLLFKHSVKDHSNKLSSWSSGEDCCAWKGVLCDNTTGRVTRLDLNQQYLEGEINLSLLQIEFLTYLDLSMNDFTALIHPPLSTAHFNLSYLEYLDLSFNEDLHFNNLQWLSQLPPSLKCLNLSEINLENETNWLQTMAMHHPSLLELRLASCGLVNMSPFVKFVNFTSLLTLDLSGNYFDSELPYWLFNVSSDIFHIDLSFNNLKGRIPKSLLNLRNLESLRLSNNELTGPIPDWLGEHERLQHLVLSENLFNGPFPSTLGNLSSLTELGVSSGFLSGNLTDTIGQLSNLRTLFIGGSLSGVLSEKHFSKLFNLESLVLNSGFSFDIDPKWIPPFQLREVSLKNTNLGPTFPEWLYTQTTLEALDTSFSKLSSINADKFWSFVAKIRAINLSFNAISADLSNVTLESEYAILACNNFRGTLPRISSNVFMINMANNSLSGPISPFLCHKSGKKSALGYLDISINSLSGVIPNCWENWRSLTFLFIGNNRLEGEIPPSIELLNEIIVMDFNKNNLSGEFSLDLSNMKSLVFINLGHNSFSGVVPTKMPESMQVMILRSNQFSSNIPQQLCSLPSLIQLDLSQNKLVGSIPPCVCNVSSMDGERRIRHFRFTFDLFWKGRELGYRDIGLLRNLDLSSNNLSGEIPTELFGLTQLLFLNLSRNHLKGKIPIKIGGMKNLESLDLSNNHLSGTIPRTISNLTFLSYLNLSYNDFSGEIPLGTQLESFDAWSYVGNPKLCGLPLPKNCSNTHQRVGSGANNSQNESLYLGMVGGFVVGLWGVWGSLFINRAWRHKYFLMLNHVADWLYEVIVLKINHFSRVRASAR